MSDEKKQKKEARVHVVVAPRNSTGWMNLMAQAAREAWRTIRVDIKLRNMLLAGKPAKLDTARAFIKARGLEDTLEAHELTDPGERQAEADEVAQKEALCEFPRREGKEGIWFPCNSIKAGFKENLSVLNYTVERRGTKPAAAEGTFIYSMNEPVKDREDLDWIYLGKEPDGVETSIVHASTPNGPISSIKRNEFVRRRELTFFIAVSRRVDFKFGADYDEVFARVLTHWAEHGMGAARSQGYGKFDVLNIEDVDNHLGQILAKAKAA